MNENLRAKAGLVYNVVEAVILGMSVLLICWTANTVIDQGKELAQLRTTSNITVSRVDALEQHGSSGLGAHERMDDQWHKDNDRRIATLESAIITLQVATSKLESMSIRIDGLVSGQARIEKQLEDSRKP